MICHNIGVHIKRNESPPTYPLFKVVRNIPPHKKNIYRGVPELFGTNWVHRWLMGIADEIPRRTELSVQEVRLCTWPLMKTSQWRYILHLSWVRGWSCLFSFLQFISHETIKNIKKSKSTILLSLCDLSMFFLSLAFTNYFLAKRHFGLEIVYLERTLVLHENVLNWAFTVIMKQ